MNEQMIMKPVWVRTLSQILYPIKLPKATSLPPKRGCSLNGTPWTWLACSNHQNLFGAASRLGLLHAWGRLSCTSIVQLSLNHWTTREFPGHPWISWLHLTSHQSPNLSSVTSKYLTQYLPSAFIASALLQPLHPSDRALWYFQGPGPFFLQPFLYTLLYYF